MESLVNTTFAQEFQTAGKSFKNFIESGVQKTEIDLHASYQSKKECEELGLDSISLRLHLILVELETGAVKTD